jgi:hypothetical protein
MDYIFANAIEIMYICFGIGFLLMALIVVRILWTVSGLMRKVGEIAEIIEICIKEPAEGFLKIYKNLDKYIKLLK